MTDSDLKLEILQTLINRGVSLQPFSEDEDYPYATGLFCTYFIGVQPASNPQTIRQTNWQQKFENNGGIYILASSAQDVNEALDSLRFEDEHVGVS